MVPSFFIPVVILWKNWCRARECRNTCSRSKVIFTGLPVFMDSKQVINSMDEQDAFGPNPPPTAGFTTLTLCKGRASAIASAADSLAIGLWGIWTIDPQQSLSIYIGGVLPLEEFVFFLMTNILLIFGVTLFLSTDSHARFN